MIKQQSNQHADLKTELIEAGIQVISEEGIENFSLRKVASKCNVSHAAPYKHFANKEDLLNTIITQMMQEFGDYLEKESMKSEQGTKQNILDLEILYVEFMVQHPSYFKMLFFYKLTPPLTLDQIRNDSPLGNPFDLLIRSTKCYFKEHPTDERTQLNFIISMWALSYGLTTMIVNNNLSIQGDNQLLVRDILSGYLNII